MNEYLYNNLIELNFPKKLAKRMAELNTSFNGGEDGQGKFEKATHALMQFKIWNDTSEGCDYWRYIYSTVQNYGIEAMHNNPKYPEFHEDKENEMTTIDLTKPVQTKDGKPARIICTDLKDGAYTLMVLIDFGDREVPRTYTSKGEYFANKPSEDDLVNVPEEKVTYLNVYDAPGSLGNGVERTTVEASNEGAVERLRAYGHERIALLKITRVDGVITKKEIVA